METDNKELIKKALLEIRSLREKVKGYEKEKRGDDIAIVGMGCRFPGGINTPDSYWNFLNSKKDAIEDVPKSRWENQAHFDENKEKSGKMYVSQGGFIDDIERFDPLFFGISPREAALIDPQHRILLEVCWEAMENASIVSERDSDANNTGVFIGITTNDYLNSIIENLDYRQINSFFGIGNAHNAASGRISHTFGFKGPSLSIDTACSSSLASVHLACQAILNDECKQALAGGVNALLHPVSSIITARAKMLSPDNRCKTFDNSANGYIRSEGCGIVVLKRYADAIEDNDNILAVIKGSGINHNAISSSLTVPNTEAQVRLIEGVLKRSNIPAERINYIEAHGTGTNLGDPIELRALEEVFADSHSSSNPLYIGAVKSNIGHAESAAGIAGLIKAVLCIQNKSIPGNLHFKDPNANIDWKNLPFKIPTEKVDWKAEQGKRCAGISSFGVSGTNAHIVIEEPDFPEEKVAQQRLTYLITLSGKSPEALESLKRKYAGFVLSNPTLNLRDICLTSNRGRNHFQYRYAKEVRNKEDLEKCFSEEGSLEKNSDKGSYQMLAFLFSGQASSLGLAKSLYQHVPSFRTAIDACEVIIKGRYNYSLIHILRGSQSPEVNNTQYMQPVLFCLQFALAKMWRSWGIEPGVLFGHGVGAYAAACISGVFTLKDGIQLIHERSRLIENIAEKEFMYLVFANEKQLKEYSTYFEGISIAAKVEANQIVISGDATKLEALIDRLNKNQIRTKKINGFHEFYSPSLLSIVEDFRKFLTKIEFNKPKILLVSGLTGKVITERVDTDYWIKQLLSPVEFFSGMETIFNSGTNLLIEIGSNSGRTDLINSFGRDNVRILPTLHEKTGNLRQINKTLAILYEAGFTINWKAVNDEKYNTVALPNYPFQKEKTWYKASSRSRLNDNLHPMCTEGVSYAKESGIQIFKNVIGKDHQFIKDHCIDGKVTIPAAAYIEIMLAIVRALDKENHAPVRLKNVSFSDIVLFEEQSELELQSICEFKDNSWQITIYYPETSPEDDPKNLNPYSIKHKPCSTGTLSANSNAESFEHGNIQMPESESAYKGEEFYAHLLKNGYHYGPTFKGIKDIWIDNDVIIGTIEPSSELSDEYPDYFLHPALLDSCFQLAGARLLQNKRQELYIPVFVGEVTLVRNRYQKLICYVKTQESKGNVSFSATYHLYNENMEPVATISNMIFRKLIKKNEELPVISKKLYQTTWEQIESETFSTKKEINNVLIFNSGVGKNYDLRNLPSYEHVTCIEVELSEVFQKQGNKKYSINYGNEEDFYKLLGQVSSVEQIVFTLDFGEGKVQGEFAQSRSSKTEVISILSLVKAIIRVYNDNLPEIIILSPIGNIFNQVENSDYVHADIWSLINIINQEEPRLRCKIISFEQGNTAINLLDKILFNSSTEEKIILKDGKVFVPRLKPYVITHTSFKKDFKLKINETGSFSDLKIKEFRPSAPGDDQVGVRIVASGLNFKEVLFALGALPMPNGDSSAFEFGFECTGIVSAVGENVTNVQVGDEVIAVIAPGSIGSYTNVNKEFIFPKPSELSFEEAATLPIVFITAYYALLNLAKIGKDSKILIHAAAGGVGLAAIQISQLHEASIYATASIKKHGTLAALGISHIYNSRSLEFEEQMLNDTKGEGVSIVLNSLSGDYIFKSLNLLKKGGWFLEIGKVNEQTIQRIKELRPDVNYFNFDIGEIAKADPALIRTVFEQVLEKVRKQDLKPIAYQSFGMQEVRQAFSILAKGANIGKMILTQYQNTGTALFYSNEYYIITGGTGALGLNLAHWLCENGAKNFILLSRTGKPKSDPLYEALQNRNANIECIKIDVCDSQAVKALFQSLKEERVNLRGIFHAAGVLDDKLIINQDSAKVLKIMSPKTIGTWNLHLHSQEFNLNYFVCFSSVASMFGSIGQSAYAAANATMDALMRYRNAMGLPATTLNWGPFEEFGMASNLKMQLNGINKLKVKNDFYAIEVALRDKVNQLCVVDVQWEKLAEDSIYYRNSTFLSLLHEKRALTQGSKEKQPEGIERKESSLSDKITQTIKSILGLSETYVIDPHKSLFDYGLDSLMAVELKNKIEKISNTEVTPTLLFNFPTLHGISNYLLEKRKENDKSKQEALAEESSDELMSVGDLAKLIDDELKDL